MPDPIQPVSPGTYMSVAQVDASGNPVTSTTPLATALYGPASHGNPQAVVNPLGGVYQYRRGPIVISDMFDPQGGIDGNRWQAGGTAPPTIVAYSGLTFTVGTTVSASSKIVSLASFNQVTSSEVVFPLTIEASPTTNNHRWAGFATEPATWAAATPIQDGWGFEVTTTGQFRAAIYSNGVAISTANLTTPAGGVSHTAQMIYRIGASHFYIDGVKVASLNGLPLSIESMYVRFHSINHTSPPGVAPTFVVAGVVARDGENLVSQQADPVYQHRRARVTASGGQVVSLGQPNTVQKKAAVSTGSVASLAVLFDRPNTIGGSIVVACAVGNATNPTVADSMGNTYTRINAQTVGAAATVAVFVASNIATVAATATSLNTVTVTNAGAAASMAVEVYEMDALLSGAAAVVDASAVATATSTTPATAALNPQGPNEFLLFAVAVGTAAQTITPAAGWTNDSGQLNPTTPAGLFSFASFSQFAGGMAAVTPTATIVSEPWAAVAVAFRPLLTSVEGSMKITDGTNLTAVKAASIPVALTDAALVVGESPFSYNHIAGATAGVTVKSGVGVLHSINVNTKGTTAVATIFDNTAASGTVIAVLDLSVSQSTLVYDVAFATGLSVSVTGTLSDLTIAYK